MANFSFDEGITTVSFSTRWALRIRVNMSATGSLMLIFFGLRLPARLREAGDLAAHREFAQLVATQTELAEHPARAAGDGAPVALARRAGVARQLLERQAGLVALFLGPR